MAQTVQSLVKGLVLFGEMDADDVLNVLLEEGRAGDAGYAYLPGHFLAELHVGLALLQVGADVRQDKIRALRIGEGDADVCLL